jgi:hypothetical protein
VFENDLEDLVPVEGVVHLATTLGSSSTSTATDAAFSCQPNAWRRCLEHSRPAK